MPTSKHSSCRHPDRLRPCPLHPAAAVLVRRTAAAHDVGIERLSLRVRPFPAAAAVAGSAVSELAVPCHAVFVLCFAVLRCAVPRCACAYLLLSGSCSGRRQSQPAQVLTHLSSTLP